MRIATVRSRLMAGTIIGGAAIAVAAGAPAYAQTAQGSSTQTVKEVVITGSRIRQPNLTATSPVTSVSSQEVKLEGTQRTEDLVNNLPQVFASMGSTLSNGSTGTATVNLRGLGCDRTLVLIDGRRLMPGDPAVGSVCADLNFIPSALIERVDVLTGGASAVYGADALAGVVNFIMKKNFEGVRIDANRSLQEHDNHDSLVEGVIAKRAPNPQFPEPSKNWWGGASTDVNITVGANSADGKGNVTAYFGYRNTEPVTQNHFDYSACALDSRGGHDLTCGGSSTSNPPRFIALDNIVSQNTISPSYTIDSANPGKLRGYTQGDRFNFAPYNFFQRNDTRYTAGFSAHYQVNSKIETYASFGFMDDFTTGQLAPSGLFFGNPYLINCTNNPLLSSDEVSKLCLNVDGNGQQAMYIGRRNTEGGPRRGDARHDQYRMVIGARGDIDDAWSYDISGQYGQVARDFVFQNSMSKEHINRALDVVNALNTGGVWSIVPIGTAGSSAQCRSVVNGTDINCVPYNIFTPGGVTAAQVNYLTTPLFSNAVQTQQIVTGFVTGKLGKYGIKSPWAEDGVNIVVGAEYRRDSLKTQFDQEQLSNDSTDGSAVDTQGATNVKELFTELRVPLVSKRPFIEDLSLNGAYRRSTYNISGTADTYSIDANWTPIADIRFRGSFNRAIRAPNVVELFAPPSFGLGGASDPCSGPITAGKTNAGYTFAQCANTGVTAGQWGNILPSPAGQYNTFGGGNKSLKPEVGDTISLGVVMRPRFIPNFSLTIDYFDIKELGVIQTIGADNILADCLANPTLMVTAPGPGGGVASNRTICSLIHRANNGALWVGDGTTANSGYTEVDNLNVGENRTRGIDFAADYRLPLERVGLKDLGRLDFNFVGTKLDKQYVQPLTGTGLGAFDCVGQYGPRCSVNSFANPEWRHKMRVTWATPWKIDASIQWRYISGIKLDGLGEPNFLSTFPAYNYIDLSFDWRLRDNLDFHGGVNNLFDKDPPLWTTGTVSGTANVPLPGGNGNTLPTVYDAMGRTIFMGLTANF